MASSRVGSRISERMGPRLPRVLGTEVASMRSIIGMRKLSVLPVPVEAVARMSEPSSAGGMALAWTGVGLEKPAAARRLLSESESLRCEKRMSSTRAGAVEFGAAWFEIRFSTWGVTNASTMGSSVAVVKIFLIDRFGRADGQAKLRSNAGVQAHHKFLESALLSRKGEALLLRGERRPLTNL